MSNLEGTMSYAASAGNVRPSSKWVVVGFWISTAIFALQMGFTAYAQLKLPQVAGEFARLGYPNYFRVELSWAKFAGLAALLVPMVPARVKEWAYAGFAITLVSAVIAHVSVAEGFDAWMWAAGTSILWGVSYFFFRRMQTDAVAR